MKPYTHFKDAKKIKISKFYLFVTVAVIFSAAMSLYSGSAEMKRLMAEREEIQALIENEEKLQLEIENQKHYFESDSYLEKVAREKLGLVKSNDVIYIDRNSAN